jgi:hypothetical protein
MRAIEYLISARNTAGTAVAQAQAQVAGLRGEAAALGAGASNLTGSLSTLAGGFVMIANPAFLAGAAVAAIGSAAVTSAMHLADSTEQLDRIAQRTGVAIEPLQVLRETMEEGGGNAESLTVALGWLNQQIGAGNPLLKTLGITTHDTFSAFRQLVTILNDTSDVGRRTDIAFQLMGRGSGELLGNLGELVSKYDEMSASMKDTGALVTEQAAGGFRRLDSATDSLHQSWKGLLTTMGTLTAPAANVVVSSLDRMLRGSIAFSREVREGAVGALEDLAAAAEKVRPVEMLDLPGGGQQAGAIERASYGGAGASAARVRVSTDDEKKAAEARAKAIGEIATNLRAAGMAARDANSAAAAYYNTLQQVASTQAGLSLIFGKKGAKDLEGDWFSPEQRKIGRESGLVAGQPVAQVLPQLTSGVKVLRKGVQEAIDDLQTLSDQEASMLTYSATVFQDLGSLVGNSIDGWMAHVFASQDAWSQFWRTMVEDALQQLARLAEARLFMILLQLLGVSTVPGVEITRQDPGWAGKIPVPTVGSQAGGAGASLANGRGPVQHVTINAFTTRDAMQVLNMPGGSLRQANAQTRLQGAY